MVDLMGRVARVASIRSWDRRRAPVTFASARSSAWANSPAERIRLKHGPVSAPAHVSVWNRRPPTVPRLNAAYPSHGVQLTVTRSPGPTAWGSSPPCLTSEAWSGCTHVWHGGLTK